MTFENLILERKLNFLWHLSNLSSETLGRQILDLQEEDRSLPSLLNDCQDHIDKIGLNMREVSKWKYKRKVKSYISNLNKNQILEEIRSYKKLSYDELSIQSFERKAYFSSLNLNKARMCFQVASCYVDTVRGNFSRKYRQKSLACPGCSEPPVPPVQSSETNQSQPSDSGSSQSEKDTQSHILVCPAYSDLC